MERTKIEKQFGLKIQGNDCISWNAKTINRYRELCDKQSNFTSPEITYIFAGSTEEANRKCDEWLKRICKTKDDIVVGPSGMVATKEAYKQWIDNINECNRLIKEECDPNEVYWYEFNNYECPINSEGDTRPIEFIIEIFGEEVARKIRRYRAFMTIDQIMLRGKKFKVDGLTVKENEVPSYIWFDYDDGKAYCMIACELHPVMLNDKQYVAESEVWWGMSCHYKNGYLYHFYKD